MRFLRSACLSILSLGLLASEPPQGTGVLTYRVKLRMQGESLPIETRFSLVPLPVVVTANRVKKSRMGSWRLEAHQPKDGAFSQAMVLARVERMLYFSGPTAETLPQQMVVRYGDRPCKIWSATIPVGVHAHAYLAEVSPGLLALSYFSGSFGSGDVASMEIQLDTFHLSAGTAPSAEGTVLLQTLRRLAAAPQGPVDTGEAQVVE